MYTNIDIRAGLELIEPLLERGHIPCHKLILDVLQWVLQNNYFVYGDTWYKQVQGAAMGSNVSGVFADLVVAAMEEEAWRKHPHLKPYLYRRYRDDTIIATEKIAKVKALTRHLSSYGTLQFNIEQMGSTVNFLDLTIYKGRRYATLGLLDFKPYTKPTNNKCFNHYTTFKPELTKCSWITGENIRILRGTADRKTFIAEMGKFRKQLRRRGYSSKIIRSKTPYQFTDRAWLMEKTEKISTNFFSVRPHRGADTRWNFLQTNFQHVLDKYNTTLTAARGRSTIDIANSACKRIINGKYSRAGGRPRCNRQSNDVKSVDTPRPHHAADGMTFTERTHRSGREKPGNDNIRRDGTNAIT